jgi:hypothetical protein
MYRAARRTKVGAALDSVGLGDRAQHKPTGNPDEDTRDEIMELIGALRLVPGPGLRRRSGRGQGHAVGDQPGFDDGGQLLRHWVE